MRIRDKKALVLCEYREYGEVVVGVYLECELNRFWHLHCVACLSNRLSWKSTLGFGGDRVWSEIKVIEKRKRSNWIREKKRFWNFMSEEDHGFCCQRRSKMDEK